MGVDLQSGGFFIDRRVARKLRANWMDLQENALRAARFGRLCPGTFLIFSGHCHSSLAATFIL